MRRSLTLLAIATSLACPAVADGKTDSAMVVKKAKQRYYHADGYIKAIGKNARRTIYNPNRHIRTRWQKAVRYLVQTRHHSWLILHPEPKQASRRRIPSWFISQALCVHRGEGAWNDHGYFGGGMQFLVGTWNRAAAMSHGSVPFVNSTKDIGAMPPPTQLYAAYLIVESDGGSWREWPNTSRACGLR